jgi:hypothetical protein
VLTSQVARNQPPEAKLRLKELRGMSSVLIGHFFAMSCYPPTTLLGGAAAGISGPAQRFRPAQRARQWLNIPFRSGPWLSRRPMPSHVGRGQYGSTRDESAAKRASFSANTRETTRGKHP